MNDARAYDEQLKDDDFEYSTDSTKLVQVWDSENNVYLWSSEESKANEDSIGSDFDFDKLLMNTPFDEQQGRLRTARDEQSPLDNIYHSGRVADRIAGGEPDTYAQDFISDWDGKALYPNYDDLDFDWIYDSTGRKVKKVESKANEWNEDEWALREEKRRNHLEHIDKALALNLESQKDYRELAEKEVLGYPDTNNPDLMKEYDH